MFERFFFNDDGTLVDRTREWSNPYTSTGTWDCKSYLYVSSYYPFNHKYFDISTANDQAGDLSIDVWYNSAWTSAVEVVDYTHDGTRAFGQSGNIFFTMEDTKGWMSESDTANITELSTKKIYGMYWMRFGFDASADSACVINYIGHKFCDDTDLYTQYPLFNNSTLKTSFKAGKTDWIDQEIGASDYIISDLKSRYLIVSKDQVLDTNRYKLPCIHKTAELIFGGMGQSYVDQKNEAKKAYDDSMNKDDFGIDRNADGKYQRSEKRTIIRRLGR